MLETWINYYIQIDAQLLKICVRNKHSNKRKQIYNGREEKKNI